MRDDLAALHRAWERHWPDLRRYAYTVARTERVPGLDVEDVAGELLLRAWRMTLRLGATGLPHWGALRLHCRWCLADLRRAALGPTRIPPGAIAPLDACERWLADVPQDETAQQSAQYAGRRWLPGEDARLRRDLPVVGYRAMAAMLGRTERAVQQHASELGIATGTGGRPRKWSDDADDYLRLVLGHVAEQTGTTPQSVAARIARLHKSRQVVG